MPYTGPRNPNPAPGDAFIIIYGYIPSLILGIIAMISFVVVLICHLVWLVKGKIGGARWFHGLMVLGCSMESIGYIFRILSHYHPFKVVYFVIQYFMIVCAPIAFSAAFYLALQYGLTTIDEKESKSLLLPLKPKIFVIIFIAIDIITTIIQVVGAALIGVSESAQGKGKVSVVTPSQANDILLAGLAFQCASFFVFLCLLTMIIMQHRNNTIGIKFASKFNSFSHPLSPPPSSPSPSPQSPPLSSPSSSSSNGMTTSFLVILSISSCLVFTRTLFRLAETAEGLFSYASTHESLFGVFEFTPVIIAVGLWAIRPIEFELRRMNRTVGVVGHEEGVEKV